MASFASSFNSFKLKLAHINIRSCRNKVVEMSLFLKENDIDILTLNKTWLKVILNWISQIITLLAMIDHKGEGEELLSLCVMILNSISLTRAPK